MKLVFTRLLCMVLLLVPSFAQKAEPASGGLPPIIDRELFFGNPEIAAAQLSPDGHYLAFLKPWKDTRNIYVKAVDEPFSAARLMTTEAKRPIAGFFWTRDSKAILYVKDNDGDENYNIFAVDPAAKPAAGAEAPASRDLTGLKGVRVQIIDVPKTAPDVLYIGINDRDKAWHDLYQVKISTGEKTLVRKNTERISGWTFDLGGKLRLAVRSAENGDTEVLRVDSDTFTKIYTCNVFESCFPIRFEVGNQRAYMMTNKGADVDLVGLASFDPATGKTELLESDAKHEVDLSGVVFNEVTNKLVGTEYDRDRHEYHFTDKAYAADYAWLEKKLAGAEVSVDDRSADEQTWLVVAHSDTEPGATYLFDRKAKKLTLQFKVRERLPRESLATVKPVRYESSDGLVIPAYLTLPKGVAARNLPAIIIPHGGPWARDHWGYNGLAQFFANRGYAVLQPNFRGSTGYGKKFLDAGNLEWGRKMQDDVTWGVKYLVAEGIADPKHVGILGGSYGGYATLAGVAYTPDVYAGAVDIVGPSNLITLLESIPPYWEAGRTLFHKRMGDPETAEGKKMLNERSPLNSVAAIKTPLLVAQGANDPRVNRREAEQIVVALRDRGFPVEYILAPDEGHGFARPVNNMALFMAAEKFLAQHVGGRYQEGGTAEVTARLKEITVDPKTVVISKPVKPTAAVKPAREPLAGVFNYQAKIEAGGQQFAMTVKTTVASDGNTWTIRDDIESPQGAATDAVTLEKGTLYQRKRAIKQGPVTIDLEYAGNKATGKMAFSGQEKPINSELGGELFADGAGSAQVVASLPLAEGYTASFINFDVQRLKVKPVELKVAGAEKIKVPAGEFDCFKVELTLGDGSDHQTLWIARDSYKVVKSSAVLASMGGATFTAELLP